MTIGLIGEGLTDQVSIENILFGYFNDKSIQVNRLQPKPHEAGNWDKVFKYCKTIEFKQSLAFNDVIIIQVDVDFYKQDSVPEYLSIDINCTTATPEEFVENVKAKLIEFIGEIFYLQYQNNIVFAIAVDQIECWFLPIYFTDSKAKKTVNCIDTLNTILADKEGFTIHAKDEDYYKKITKHFHKKKELLKFAQKNPSFNLFIEELNTKIIAAPPLPPPIATSSEEANV